MREPTVPDGWKQTRPVLTQSFGSVRFYEDASGLKHVKTQATGGAGELVRLAREAGASGKRLCSTALSRVRL